MYGMKELLDEIANRLMGEFEDKGEARGIIDVSITPLEETLDGHFGGPNLTLLMGTSVSELAKLFFAAGRLAALRASAVSLMADEYAEDERLSAVPDRVRDTLLLIVGIDAAFSSNDESPKSKFFRALAEHLQMFNDEFGHMKDVMVMFGLEPLDFGIL